MTVREAWLQLRPGTIIRCQAGDFVKLNAGMYDCVVLRTGEIAHVSNFLPLQEQYTWQFQTVHLAGKKPAIRFWGLDPIVAEWDGFFLRDDEEEEEGYSLFRVVGGNIQRECVFIGSYHYALYESEKLIRSSC